MLQRAASVVQAYASSDRTQPLNFPVHLTRGDRQSLHCLAERLGLNHKSEGEGRDQRFLVISKRAGALRHTSCHTGAEGSAAGGVDDGSACNKHWEDVQVKYDVRHWMGNLFLMAVTKDSALFKYFCVAFSDAIFKIVPESREEVLTRLRALGLSPERIKRVPRKYWRSRARYVVGAPEQLVRDLTDVCEFFKDLIDPSTSRSLFNSDHKKRFEHELTYVRRGDLSDPPGVAMYIKVGVYKSGLQKFLCLRSSSHLEGYHLHLRLVLCPGAVSASLRWQEAVTNHFDYVWSVKSMIRLKLLPGWVQHFDLHLYDRLYDIASAL
ncbi:unnamed protein product, partial [Laminaria digitata]